ncbi:MAG: septum formation initiator family protein [Oscillospiraceae bacterium]|nr:septum formation initiator family protein [Oscillospiraceae bacterium]
MMFRIAILIFALLIAVDIINSQVRLSDDKEHLSQIREQIQAEQQKKIELQELLEIHNNPETIVRIAREHLGYVFPDERVFINITGE